VPVEERHGLALPAAVVQRKDSDTGPGVLPVEGHEGAGGGDVVPVRLVAAHADLADAGLRLGHNGCGIFVLGSLESPGHGYWLLGCDGGLRSDVMAIRCGCGGYWMFSGRV